MGHVTKQTESTLSSEDGALTAWMKVNPRSPLTTAGNYRSGPRTRSRLLA